MLSRLDDLAAEALRGKSVLVTGAAGTIGRALTERLLRFRPRVVRLLDHDEERTFYMDLAYNQRDDVRVLLGDIRDRERMARALQGIDIVFHAAALKHVGLGEYNPFEVVRTNLVALQGMVELSIDANVKKFVFMSSDKAVNPTNVMGGSKFIGERLVSAGNLYRGRAETVFTSTRFGNVLGSAGSVVPVLRAQIERGGPVTVTNKGMTRFFMSLGEAVDLALAATVASLGGEVFVPKMHAIRLVDLADAMIGILSPDTPIETREVGLRAGEKLYEELVSEHELERCLETERLLIVLPFVEEARFEVRGREAIELGPQDYPDGARWCREAGSSRNTTPIDRATVLELLRTTLAAVK